MSKQPEHPSVTANAIPATATATAHGAKARLTVDQPGGSAHIGQPPGYAPAVATTARSRHADQLAEEARRLHAQGVRIEGLNGIAERLKREPRTIYRYLKRPPA